MSFQAQLVMILWIPIVLYLFRRFSIYKAIIISFIFAWLFLPQKAGFDIPGLPDYERSSATCYAVLIGILIFAAGKQKLTRLSWIDIPIIIYCINPFFSSILNGLGIYDGLSGTLATIIQYGLPYFIGKIYLHDTKALSYLAKSILISGLIYVPLCLYEVRMSPQLHNMLYGYQGTQFGQTFRYGGWRPAVFMRHGLSVGMWMMAATLIAFWLWQSGVVKKLWNIPIKVIVFILLVTFILLKSTGAYVYLLYGLIVLFCAKLFRFSFPLILLSFLISCYLLVASTGQLSQERIQNITSPLSLVFPEERISSLEFRLDNEHLLVQKALEQPIFGWGGWGRNRIKQENSQGILVDVSVTDSLWIISFGDGGAVALVSVFAIILIPPIYFYLKYPAKLWLTPNYAAIAVLSTILVLYSFDCTLNNQFNPVFILISGAVSGYLVDKNPRTYKRIKIIKVAKKRAPRLIQDNRE